MASTWPTNSLRESRIARATLCWSFILIAFISCLAFSLYAAGTLRLGFNGDTDGWGRSLMLGGGACILALSGPPLCLGAGFAASPAERGAARVTVAAWLLTACLTLTALFGH